jgi:uncharacterized protein (TIGR00369 family)
MPQPRDVRYPETPNDLPSIEEMANMSGLEFMEKVRDGALPAAPIAKALGFWLDEVSDGRVVFRAKPGLHAYNPAGAVHGGWFGTLLDSCMACAIQTRVPRGHAYTTLEYKVNLLRPVYHDTEEVLAIGEVDHVGRRTGVSSGRIVGAESGKLYATGSTTCIVMKVG